MSEPSEYDDMLGRVRELWRYPVKSMQGERVDSVQVDALGIAGDRRYAVRDLTTGSIVSAKLASLGRPLLTCSAITTGDTVAVTVRGSTYDTRDDIEALDHALSALLGRPVHLDAVGANSETYASEWPEIEGLALSGVTLDLPLHEGTFADLAPLHLLTTSSIAQLAALTPDSTVTTQRFRPGILIDDDHDDHDRHDNHADSPLPVSFIENDWVGRTASIGSARITFGEASPRCIMTTLEQPGLDGDKGILRTIADHNRRGFGGFGDFACLGIYGEIAAAGTICVGDAIVSIT